MTEISDSINLTLQLQQSRMDWDRKWQEIENDAENILLKIFGLT